MKKILFRYGKAVVTFVAALAVMLFFAYGHPELLSFHEQYQLFLFTPEYLNEHLALPGGIAAYIARFISQFYYTPVFGGALIAMLMVLLQILVYKMLKGESFFLSFIPSLLLVAAMGQESLMLAYVVSIIIAVAMAVKVRAEGARGIVTSCLSVIIAYWVAGPMAWLTVVLIALCRKDKLVMWIGNLIAMCLAVGFMHYYAVMNVPYPAFRLLAGLFYYRLLAPLPMLALSVPLVIVLFVAIKRCADCYVPMKNLLHHDVVQKTWFKGVEALAVVILALTIIPKEYNTVDHKLIRSDYLLRAQAWTMIIADAEKETPDKPFTVAAFNLALGMQGQLCDRMFDFFQNGTEGLMPSFIRDYNAPLAAAEAFWQLGLVNVCQQFMFESMEAIPDYQKSGRIVKRLVQTNIVNGQYGVAMKYINMLKHTLYYKTWAEKQEALLKLDKDKREQAINADPVYGAKREMILDEDFLYSDTEVDKIIGRLYVQNPENTLAMQYLLAYPLLMKDLQRFMAYNGLVQQKQKFMPQAVQEALAIVYAQQGKQVPQNLLNGSYARYLSN